jgi:hypothetical protein
LSPFRLLLLLPLLLLLLLLPLPPLLLPLLLLPLLLLPLLPPPGPPLMSSFNSLFRLSSSNLGIPVS